MVAVPTNGVITSTIDNFSRRTGICRAKIYTMLDSGELESAKVGKSRLIIEESYHRLVQRSRVPPKTKATAE
jgi:excisionase family DNA binding protein